MPTLVCEWSGVLAVDAARGTTAATLAPGARHGGPSGIARLPWPTAVPVRSSDAAGLPPLGTGAAASSWVPDPMHTPELAAPGAGDLLAAAADLGWRVVVVTSAVDGVVERTVTAHRWDRHVSAIHTGVPDVAVVLRGLISEGSPVVYLGAHDRAITQARLAGASVIGLALDQRGREALRHAGADRVVGHLRAVKRELKTGSAPIGPGPEVARLQVLTSAGGRSSGYLIHSGGKCVLVDCGPGVVAALDRSGLMDHVEAIVLTHSHADHVLDTVALAFASQWPDPAQTRRALYAPQQTLDVLDQLDTLLGIPTLEELRRPIASTFATTALSLDGTRGLEVLPRLKLVAYQGRHAVPSAALRFTTPDGHVVAFSSDTGYTDPVAAAADGADLFICEATYSRPRADDPHGHLTAEQAGELAERAHARTLAVCHLSDPADASSAVDRAQGAGVNLDVIAAQPGVIVAI